MSRPGEAPPRRYRYKWFTQLAMLIAAFNRLLWLGVLATLMGLLVVLFSHFVSEGIPPIAIMLLCPTLLVPIALGGILVFGLIARGGGVLLSYVGVTPGGLEVRRWPLYRVFCRWDGVKRIGTYHMVWLDDAEAMEEGAFGTVLRWLANRVRRVQPADGLYLNSVRGYPVGEFADDLRRYAPHLFETGDDEG